MISEQSGCRVLAWKSFFVALCARLQQSGLLKVVSSNRMALVDPPKSVARLRRHEVVMLLRKNLSSSLKRVFEVIRVSSMELLVAMGV